MGEYVDFALAAEEPQGLYHQFERYTGADPRLRLRHVRRLQRLSTAPMLPLAIWLRFVEDTREPNGAASLAGAIALYDRQSTGQVGVDVAYQRLSPVARNSERQACLAVGIAFAIAGGADAVHIRETGLRHAKSWMERQLAGEAYFYRELNQAYVGLTPQHQLYVGGAVMNALASLDISAATVEPTHPWRGTLERAEKAGMSYRDDK